MLWVLLDLKKEQGEAFRKILGLEEGAKMIAANLNTAARTADSLAVTVKALPFWGIRLMGI